MARLGIHEVVRVVDVPVLVGLVTAVALYGAFLDSVIACENSCARISPIVLDSRFAHHSDRLLVLIVALPREGSRRTPW